MVADAALLMSNHARTEERLHLQVLVVVVEHRRVHRDPPVGHRALQATFIAPRELGPKGPAGPRAVTLSPPLLKPRVAET